MIAGIPRSSSRIKVFAILASFLFAPALCLEHGAEEETQGCPFLASLSLPATREELSGGDLVQTLLGYENKHRDLRRYDHYKSGSAYQYKNYRNKKSDVYSSLADIWLCLACALGWTVWLVSTMRSQSNVDAGMMGMGSIMFEEKESREVIGNVLQVSLGEDPDGTGIPVYHTLVDYVVENEDDPDEDPLQIRKCFTTRHLLQEGFANVKVLVLLEDATTSILMEDFVQDRWTRSMQKLEPPDMIYTTMVYLMAAILIITSLIGGLHAYFLLDPEHMMWGKVSLAVGTLLLYPVALLIFLILDAGYRWAAPLIQRPGVIIHGAKNIWDRKCGATLNPLEVMGGNSFEASTPSPAEEKAAARRKRRTESNLSAVMEMSSVTSNSIDSRQRKHKERQEQKKYTRSPMYPNAGCGFGNFNVMLPRGRSENEADNTEKKAYDLAVDSVSSMSSGGTGLNGIARKKEKAPEGDLQMPMPDMDESSYTNIGNHQSTPLRIRPRGLSEEVAATSSGGGEYKPPAPIVAARLGGAVISLNDVPTPLVSNVLGSEGKPIKIETPHRPPPPSVRQTSQDSS